MATPRSPRHLPVVQRDTVLHFFVFFFQNTGNRKFREAPINLNDGENETRISYIIYNFFFLKIFIIQPHVDSKMEILVSRNNNVISERTANQVNIHIMQQFCDKFDKRIIIKLFQ